MSEVTELRLRRGVFSFDGRVLERFGFGYSETQRIHINQIKSVEVKHKRLVGTVIDVKGFVGSLAGALDLDESEQAQLDEFFAEVNAAAATKEIA